MKSVAKKKELAEWFLTIAMVLGAAAMWVYGPSTRIARADEGDPSPPPGMEMCGDVAYDPATEGCCNGTKYNLRTEGCCTGPGGSGAKFNLASEWCCPECGCVYDNDN